MNNDHIKKYRSGIFGDQTSAEAAYQAAIQHGYRPEDINVLMSDETRNRYSGSSIAKTAAGDKSMEGLALGGALGGTVIGILAAVVALASTITIPGVGLVIAGPLAAGLVGAGAGSISGGIIGALIGAGIPEEHAKKYESGIKNGGTIIIVDSKGAEEDQLLMNDWKRNKGADIY